MNITEFSNANGKDAVSILGFTKGQQEAYKRFIAGATDATVSVYTGPWSNANYGKQPRGYGYWAFAYKRNPNVDEMFFFSGNYVDAKKKAVEKAKAEGKTAIYVLS